MAHTNFSNAWKGYLPKSGLAHEVFGFYSRLTFSYITCINYIIKTKGTLIRTTHNYYGLDIWIRLNMKLTYYLHVPKWLCDEFLNLLRPDQNDV